MEDSLKYKGLRKQLVESLRKRGLKNETLFEERILQILEKVPRHFFVDKGLELLSYEDKPLPIAAGQTISQPYTVAYQTQLLDVQKDMKVLEVGTGSGYQCAVLCELGLRVFSIERQETLFRKTMLLMKQLGYLPKLFFGDGYKGLPTYAPFDRIIITAGASQIPEKLLEQLKVGGFMIVPIGDGSNQVMTKVIRVAENEYKNLTFDNFLFVPMLEGKAKTNDK